MTRLAQRAVRAAGRGRDTRHRRDGRATVDATREPSPGPIPEAVFDRVTGPYPHHRAPAGPGAPARDEDA